MQDMSLRMACEAKLTKMKSKKLIASGELSYSSVTDELNAWIKRKDGYSIVIRDIISVEDFLERAKRFCQKKLKRK